MDSYGDAQRQADLWDAWARNRTELYPNSDPTRAVAFLSERVDGGQALELGVGTGRVAIPLAATGVRVVGIDVAPAVGEVLTSKVGDLPIEVVLGDMASFDLAPRFDVVYAVRSTFFHLTEPERQIACLRSAARHLAPGGSVVLDCYVPTRDFLAQRTNLILRGVDDEGLDIRATSVSLAMQRVTFRELRVTSRGIEILPAEQRFCWPSELDLMARLAGLTLRERFADFEGRTFDDDSPRHISVYVASPP